MGWGMRLGVDVLWHPQDMLSQGREGKFHQIFFFFRSGDVTGELDLEERT